MSLCFFNPPYEFGQIYFSSYFFNSDHGILAYTRVTLFFNPLYEFGQIYFSPYFFNLENSIILCKTFFPFHAKWTDVKIAIIILCTTIKLLGIQYSLQLFIKVLRFTRVFYGTLAPYEVSEAIHTP